MIWVNIAFWILLGLYFLGVGSIPYHESIMGVLALVIGIVALANALRR